MVLERVRSLEDILHQSKRFRRLSTENIMLNTCLPFKTFSRRAFCVEAADFHVLPIFIQSTYVIEEFRETLKIRRDNGIM
ncbi:hypothetical protein DACRYDRAFT_23361, partial [Dacryopinax primogenitus]